MTKSNYTQHDLESFGYSELIEYSLNLQKRLNKLESNLPKSDDTQLSIHKILTLLNKLESEGLDQIEVKEILKEMVE